MNGRDGITAADEEAGENFIQIQKACGLAVNKVDNPEMRELIL